MQGIELVATVAEKNLFAALSNHTHRWLEHRVKWCRRIGGAVQDQPRERLFRSIFGQNPLDSLHEFLAIRVRPLDLAGSRLLGHHMHHPLFSCFSLLQWEALQNSSIIVHSYSTTPSVGASIMTTREARFHGNRRHGAHRFSRTRTS